MSDWARLTWQSADPAALAAELAARLGPGGTAHPRLGGTLVVPLGACDLELVPWRPEAADDRPRAEGRLVLEPIRDRAGADRRDGPAAAGGSAAPGGAGGPPPAILVPAALRLAGICWGTVELDRAEAELDAWLVPREDHRGQGRRPAHDPVDEPHLGARARVRRSDGLPGRRIVIAEPVTEGRLAAVLARDGEGPCALYLEAAAGLDAWADAAVRRGGRVRRARRGPLGRSALVPGSARGPQLVIVEPGRD